VAKLKPARYLGWLMLTLASVVYACYVGYRMPSDWTVNYYQLNWWDGFGRRALLGTLLYPLGCSLFNFEIIARLQFTVLCGCILTFVWMAVRRGLMAVAPLFFLSAAGGYLFHEVGYIDQVIWLLGALVLWLLSRDKDIAASFLLSACMFTHEMTLLQVLPIVIAYLMLAPTQELRRYILLLLPALGVFLLIWLKLQTVDEATVLTYFQRVFTCEYPVHRPDFYSIFLHRFSDRMNFYYSWIEVLTCILPLMVFASIGLLNVTLKGQHPRVQRFVLWCCSLSPLLLGLMGWDTDRWFFITFVQIILVRMVTISRSENSRDKWPFIATMAVMALLLRLNYFDDVKPRPLSLTEFLKFFGLV